MEQEQIMNDRNNDKLRNRFFKIAYILFVLAFSALLFFLREHGFAWEASVFSYLFLTILSVLWPAYLYFKTKNKENLLLIVFALAIWGLPLLSTLTKGR
ncbi:hypothetical protein [Dubosiella newyorkensis]|jgi:hypothetical protein|uniref:hypothetical protein n=1 Tax=Dubosiella newyorkensis TaxID=1862672 RepID=UPI002354AEB3|nr:hypothetical protein [Dubosiella newyorkensis]MCI9040424.1 hypothetical protein [Dubosiella newyorkensis]